jgi:hypothetical protein
MLKFITKNQTKIDEYIKDHTLSRLVNGFPYYTHGELLNYKWSSGPQMFIINYHKIEIPYRKVNKDFSVFEKTLKIKVQDVRFVGYMPGCLIPMLVTKNCSFYLGIKNGITYCYRDPNYSSPPEQSVDDWELELFLFK